MMYGQVKALKDRGIDPATIQPHLDRGMRAGKALRRVGAPEHVIPHLAGILSANLASLQFASTESDIRRVYEAVDCSCMTGHKSILPALAYADSPDIAVAYWVDGDQITARAVVNTADLRFARIYGDGSAALRNALLAVGYHEHRHALTGCRVNLRGVVVKTNDARTRRGAVVRDQWTPAGYARSHVRNYRVILEYRSRHWEPVLPWIDGAETVYPSRCSRFGYIDYDPDDATWFVSARIIREETACNVLNGGQLI